ncbi:hypothetical protein KKG83_01385, partial [Candidatus Micrarchaeota archaeon]|nr:hypothetical protein [Candidatus Micrarchaeota archaeon]
MKKWILIVLVFQLTLASADIGITDPIPEQLKRGLPIDPKQEIVVNMPATLETGTIYNVKLTEETKPILLTTNAEIQVYEATAIVEKENENTYIPTAAPGGV